MVFGWKLGIFTTHRVAKCEGGYQEVFMVEEYSETIWSIHAYLHFTEGTPRPRKRKGFGAAHPASVAETGLELGSPDLSQFQHRPLWRGSGVEGQGRGKRRGV